MKLKLTRNEREMIHIATLLTFAFTLFGTVIIALALTL